VKKAYALVLLLFIGTCLKVNAQTALYGAIDTADIKLTSCDFDKGANAMVLFDVGKITYTKYEALVMERHRRIKIFNDKGTSEANIRLEYYGGRSIEDIKNVEAQTINLAGNKIVITPLDKKLIYTIKVDKQRRAIVFTLPNVKAGSVIEVKYTFKTDYGANYPNWLFQGVIPTRYSELNADLILRYKFNVIKKVTQKFVNDTSFRVKDSFTRTNIWSLKNIPGFRVEPYMHSVEDNVQGIYFKPARMFSFWDAIARQIIDDEDFGRQLKLPLDKEAQLIADAKDLTTDDEKIAYLFNTVKNTMKWNETDKWYAEDGIQKAWLSKTGNATEINLILYHLLKSVGVKATLLVLGTRGHGEIEIGNPSFGRLNKTVVRVPIDSLNFYVMDASGKYNTYNDTPYELLGLNMLTIDPDVRKTDVIQLKTVIPSKEVVFVNAKINPQGQLEGTVQKTSSNYKRTSKLKLFDDIGEKKYIKDELEEGNSNLKVSGHKFIDMEVDTLPLREDFDFKLELTGSDDNYIYVNPNLFTGLGQNPFLSESRLSDIDFIYLNTYSINGRYTVPAGYKIDVMPKPLTIVMPDNSITFKRFVGEFEGTVIVNYAISFKKTKYARDDYSEVREFYKKMYELLNEQVVLKKS
jgi:hypothetical protein